MLGRGMNETQIKEGIYKLERRYGLRRVVAKNEEEIALRRVKAGFSGLLHLICSTHG